MPVESPPFSVSVDRPSGPAAALLFAHGAGAPKDHWFMEAMSERLCARGLLVLRFNFPYMDAGRRRPDHRTRLLGSVREALAWAATEADGIPLFAGGKSMGGRMTSNLLAEEPRDSVAGLVFFGFPLHPAGKPAVERGEHLARVCCPMLFLQGTRDRLADLDLLGPLVTDLGVSSSDDTGASNTAKLHVVDGADHGFQVLKRSGRAREEVWDELADVTQEWIYEQVGEKAR